MELENQVEEQGTPGTDNSQTVAKEERYKQIIAGKEKQAKEAEHARLLEKTARHVLAKPEMLAEINPEIGREVAKMLYAEGLATTDDYDSLVSTVKPKETTKEVDVDKIVEEKLRKREEERLARETESLVESWLAKIPEGKRDAMKEDYEDLSDGRTLKPEKAKKLIEKIEASYKKEELEEERRDGALARTASASIGRGTAPESKKASKPLLSSLRAMGYSDKDLKELGYI